MAYGGFEESGDWRKFVTFQGNPNDLQKFLSTHKPSDPSWNKYANGYSITCIMIIQITSCDRRQLYDMRRKLKWLLIIIRLL